MSISHSLSKVQKKLTDAWKRSGMVMCFLDARCTVGNASKLTLWSRSNSLQWFTSLLVKAQKRSVKDRQTDAPTDFASTRLKTGIRRPRQWLSCLSTWQVSLLYLIAITRLEKEGSRFDWFKKKHLEKQFVSDILTEISHFILWYLIKTNLNKVIGPTLRASALSGIHRQKFKWLFSYFSDVPK